MQTRNQTFAIKVYRKVEPHLSKKKEERTKYGTMAQKLPVLIRTAGLAQAISFLEAKSKKDSEEMNKQLLDDLSGTVAEMMGFDKSNFAEKCRNAEMSEYLRLTQNTLAALLWFKRFSVSVLEVKENAGSN
jgi:CRISPR-associated protein Cmr5